ncbi:hypothetical protein [Rhodopirellula bahusiensis]|uniref:Uncharacterized protein n=1 Tax=Rhodopirellula bahusiensis TaxID=2014065 RepID=A0A2G1W755_9BACT|nr:hypothetical protein [Rhodopirellula bahusiensis]PHQ34670.1 hypothetical protein CEE69_14840 [Rhodopirellula bahusiensis]
MFDGSLDALCLLPPQFGCGRRGVPPTPPTFQVRRDGDSTIELPTRLFLDEAPWHRWSSKIAKAFAEQLQQHGILTSYLHSELGVQDDGDDSQESEEVEAPAHPLQMLPYRSERYGLNADDFDTATAIDLRLSPLRDASGRFAYSAEQIRRWEATPEEQPLSGGGWVSAFTLPPDVLDLANLQNKIQQLRSLAPQAAVLVSITPEWLWENRETLGAIPADALLIRAGQVSVAGLPFAELLHQLIRQPDIPPIWLSPPRWEQQRVASVDDCVKLVSLGVSAIAIDGWMDEVFAAIDEVPEPSIYSGSPASQLDHAITPILEEYLLPLVERFTALMTTITHSPSLGSFDQATAARLDILHLGR